MNNYNTKYALGKGIQTWKSGEAYQITFVVTKDCNLRCKYCYISHKNAEERMSFDVAKKTVDYILDNPQIFDSDAAIWDFIGGEPFLEIDLIDNICDYIKIETYKRNHKWSHLYRFSFSTNGISYSNDAVQKFIRKNFGKLSIGITIDGTKQKHDMQRVYPDGRGSYDDVVKNIPLWSKQLPGMTTKVTISHDDLPFLKESILHLWELGLKNVPANVVFEDVWQSGDAELLEQQMKGIADYAIDNGLWQEYNCTLFSDAIGYPNTKQLLNSNFCGSGKMLAIDSQGKFYPCLRFMGYSLNNKPEYTIGDINAKIDFDKVRPFIGLNVPSQSDNECVDCEVAVGCAWCQGNNYDSADTKTIYQRSKSICEMHKARCRANNYFWERLYKEHNIKRQSPYNHKRHIYFIMSDDSIEHCTYKSLEKSSNLMDKSVLEKGIEFADKNFYTPIFLHSKSVNNVNHLDCINNISDRIDIYNSEVSKLVNSVNGITVLDAERNLDNVSYIGNCILKMDNDKINELSDTIINLFSKVSRINFSINFVSKDFDYNKYEGELSKVVDYISQRYENGEILEMNNITDRLILDEMDNCNCGKYNYALAPNGKFYICPAFYFDNPNNYIGTIEDGITLENKYLFDLENAPICSKCDAYHW